MSHSSRQCPVVVLDNGAGSCKIGMGGEPTPRRVFPNCTAKPKGERQGYVGAMLLDSKDISQLTLRRPFDRGYLVNWDLEREIWSHAFRAVLGLGKAGAPVSVQDCGLLLSEPLFNFSPIQAATEQVVFEEFGFNSLYAAPAPLFSLRRMAAVNPTLPAAQAGAGVVVDAGFSFMHAVPFFDWNPVMQGVRRVDIGGKALTNHLKELVSYRSLNMMDEPYLMERVKECLCFVSRDPRLDLKLASMRNSPHRREFVLPDGVSNFRGYVRPVDVPATARQQPQASQGLAAAAAAAGASDAAAGTAPAASAAAMGGAGAVQQQQQGAGTAAPAGGDAAPSKPRAPATSAEQVLVLNNERFMVPELAFYPTDIGLDQAGITEAVQQAVQALPASLHGLLYSNIILTGGLVSCGGFSERFADEMQPLVPDHFALGVSTPPDPVTCAWEGMSSFVASGQYHAVALTRAQYEETGGSRDKL